MGDKNTTVQNLEIEKIDLEDNLLLIKGAVPGSIGSFVKVTPSIKDGARLSLMPVVDDLKDEATPTEEVKEATPTEEAKEAASTEEVKEATPVEEAKEAAPVEEAKEAAPVEEAKEKDESEKK